MQVVAAAGGGEYGAVKNGDSPAVGVVSRHRLEPPSLRFPFFVGVQGDEAHPLLVEVVDGLL